MARKSRARPRPARTCPDWRDAPALLVPLVRDAVRDVDLDARVIDVDLAFLGEE